MASSSKNKKDMDDQVVTYRVRITRVYAGQSKPYDDDNLSGGAKALRDTIATFLGRRGDDEKDGLFFEYDQVKGSEGKIQVEIFETYSYSETLEARKALMDNFGQDWEYEVRKLPNHLAMFLYEKLIKG